MKKSDFFFWGVLAAIALFLVLKGNDMHRDYYDLISQKVKQQHNVKDTNQSN